MIPRARTGLRSCALCVMVCVFVLLLAVPAMAQREQESEDRSKILGAYFEEWSIYYAGYGLANLESNGSAAKLSHLLYAFANVTSPTPTGSSCVIADAWADFESPYLAPVGGIPSVSPLFGNFAEIVKLKQLHPKLKTLISIGGASAANAAAFSAAASSDAGRKALVASCINMFVLGNVGSYWNGTVVVPGLFDGFDIDWEFPTAADKPNFTLLLKEFRKQLNELSETTGKTYLLSFFGPAGAQNYTNIDLSEAAELVDFINMQGYDFAGAWEATTNHASPLFDARQNPNFGQGLDLNDVVNAYLSAGVPKHKISMGLPLYGHGWMGVPNTFHGLYQNSTEPSAVLLANGTGNCPDLSGATPGCDTLLTPGNATYATLSTVTANGYTRYYDPERVAVWLYNASTETFYTYDDPFTAMLKMIYVDARELGGAYVWAAKDDDASGTMIKTMARWLGR
jgi:chitinase